MRTFHIPEYRSTETLVPYTGLLSTVPKGGRTLNWPPSILSPVKPESVIYELTLFRAFDGGLGISNKLNASNGLELFRVLCGLSHCVAEVEELLSQMGIDLELYDSYKSLFNKDKALEV